MKISSAILLLAIIGLLSSCSESYYFEKIVEFQDKEWNQDEPIDFNFTIGDSLQAYDLYLDLKASKEYPYENIYIKLETSFPTDTIISDRLSLEINNKDGSYTGECSGSSCTTRFVLQKSARFRHLGDYSLRIKQDTRDTLLEGVESLSFYIQKSVTAD